ncbi:hypothetical protein [Paraburkholderia phytofirmans]|uniref:Uncharacterized protein n=1 Tax=Paraburkholderia phytofirmans (strain DSM 17436 / LMG 22146 / PsJN) TaxID=398527 RepID=B2TH55_PARPJ|nr:hypothetical protein [Paraburkholderia phytofirmans]ACD21604.1 hypothetical protein Bphyt_7319 [Paraburkholderia phytofirmans PsJN]
MKKTGRFLVVGVDDSQNFCQCCGRTGLKRVAWIRDTETDEVKHFGMNCATAPAKAFGVAHEIRLALRAFENAQAIRAARASRTYRAAGGEYTKVGPTQWQVADRNLWAKCFAAA